MALPISILILAAGNSSRMGEPKMLLPWGKLSVLEAVLETAMSINASEVYLVAGAESTSLKETASKYDIKLIENPHWERGMGHSLARGVALAQNSDPEGIMVLLADMPTVQTATLNGLIDTFKQTKADIICTKYPQLQAVPAIFRKNIFARLTRLDGEVGAKQLFQLSDITVASYPIESAYEDIDTPETYQQLKKKYNL